MADGNKSTCAAFQLCCCWTTSSITLTFDLVAKFKNISVNVSTVTELTHDWSGRFSIHLHFVRIEISETWNGIPRIQEVSRPCENTCLLDNGRRWTDPCCTNRTCILTRQLLYVVHSHRRHLNNLSSLWISTRATLSLLLISDLLVVIAVMVPKLLTRYHFPVFAHGAVIDCSVLKR